MADQPVTREKLINADKDVQTIEDFIKKPKDETVTTRFGDKIMTLKGLEEEVKKSGGYFKRYTTLAAANADIANIPVNSVVKVTSEADGGDYERVSEEATSLTKSPYDPLEYVKNTGFANVVGAAVANINYTTSDRKLTFANTISIITGTTSYQLVTPQSVDLPLNTPYRLQINTTTKIISAVAYTDAVVEGELILGFVTASNTGLKTVDFAYAVDGVAQDNLTKDYFSKNGFAKLLPLTDQNINFVTSTNTLSFTGTIWVTSNGQSYQLDTPQNLVLASNGVYRIELNSNTKELKAVPYSNVRKEGDLLVGVVKKSGATLTSTDFGYFTTDGVLINPYEANIPKGQRADLQALTLNVNIATKVLTLTDNAWAYTSDGKVLVKSGAYSYPAANGTYIALFNRSTEGIEFYGFSTYLPLLNAGTHYYLFMLESATGKLYGYSGKSTVTGGTSVVDSAKTNYSLMLTKASTLNFDFINNKIVVSGGLWIQHDGGRIAIAAQEIALDPARNKGFAQILLVNPTDSSMYVKSQAAPYTVPKDHLQVGAYFENDMIFFGLDHFSVNGEPFQKAASVRPSFGWDFNNKVDVDVSDSLTTTDPLYMGNLDSTIVYGWFDQLVTDFPDYVTKTTLGNDETDTLPIHQYRFKPKLPSQLQAGLNTKIPKVMLITIHNEGMNMVALHIMMREICRSWQNSESLESMRHGLEFVVIPVGNPWGLDNGKRTNVNQIDINRQFPANWIQDGVPGDYFYSGTAALSEAEAQHLYAAMVAEKPDVYFDVHSYGSWNKEGTSAWIAILNEKTNSAVISAMTKIYAQYKKKYPWIVDIDKFMDVSNENILGGGTSSKSAASLGAVGGTFETAWNLKNSPDGEPRGHTPAINFSTDLLATCILQSIGVVIASK